MKRLALSLVLVALLGACASTPSAPAPRTLREMYALPRVTHLERPHTALVLVDLQDEFVHGGLAIADAPCAIERAAVLLAWARAERLVIVHVRNVTRPGAALFAPGGPHSAFAPEVAPRGEELVLDKPTGGAFTKTALDARLRERAVDTLVVVGIMTHLAVAMTAEDGAVLGYRVLVAADGTTTRDLPGVDRATLQRASLAAIADRFADVMPAASIVALPVRD